MKGIHQKVRSIKPRLSAFDLSYAKLFTCEMGQLIPVMCEECIPGDVWKIANNTLIRMQPMVAPIIHDIDMFVHVFFVPYRLLFAGPDTGDAAGQTWERFITGGEKAGIPGTPGYGNDGLADVSLPRWQPSIPLGGSLKHSLWDYMGFPTDVISSGVALNPLDFPRRAYNFIYNNYYLDQVHQEPVSLTNENVLLRNWQKDYFTSSLPDRQKGVAPGFGVTGTGNIEFNANFSPGSWGIPVIRLPSVSPGSSPLPLLTGGNVAGSVVGLYGHSNNAPLAQVTSSNMNWSSSEQLSDQFIAAFGKAGTQNFYTDLARGLRIQSGSLVMNADVSDFRLAFAIQRWMERNMRAGSRYFELLRSRWGVSPRDERLDRPEYIGGCRTPIVISEVLQTSETTGYHPDEVLGGMAGHGISGSSQYCGTYHVKEYGLIMGIMSIMPKPSYSQGIDKNWLRESRYDFPFPEFVNLSEQAVLQGEIYWKGVPDDRNPISYQARYDELRINRSVYCGDMRDTLDYWHLGRKFQNAPMINGEFIKCKPEETRHIFAVQTIINPDTGLEEPVPGLIVNCGNIIRAIRPIPYMAEPGLIDHV